jgi:hypothetical protein
VTRREHGTEVTVLTREKSFQDCDAVGEHRRIFPNSLTKRRSVFTK